MRTTTPENHNCHDDTEPLSALRRVQRRAGLRRHELQAVHIGQRAVRHDTCDGSRERQIHRVEGARSRVADDEPRTKPDDAIAEDCNSRLIVPRKCRSVARRMHGDRPCAHAYNYGCDESVK